VEGSQILYDNEPGFFAPVRSNSCYQNVTVIEGEVNLNAGVEYSGSGSCGCVETVTLLVVLIPPSTEVFSCNNGNNCPKSNKITTRRRSELPYDYDIGLSTSQSGEYHARFTLVDPTSISGRSLFKIFDVNILRIPGTAPT